MEIGDGATHIGQGAFLLCTSLTSVAIPNSVTSIGEAAFSACQVLTSITIPASVTALDDDVFMGCIALTAINVEATTPPKIGNTVFYFISDDAKIYVPAGTEDAYKTKWSVYADMIVSSDTGINNIGSSTSSRQNVNLKRVKNGKLFIETPNGNFTVAGARSE